MTHTDYRCTCGYAMTATQWRNARGEKCPDCQRVEVRDFQAVESRKK